MNTLNAFTTFLTGLLAWIIFLQVLARVGTAINNHLVEYWARLFASFTALFICATYGTIASAGLSAAGKGGLGQWTTARSFKWTMWVVTGMWFSIDDPNDYLNTIRPAVFVGNHQTELDVLFLGHIFPKYCSVTAKKSLKYWPFLGWFMAASKTVFIERTSRTQAFAAFDKAAAEMKQDRQSVYIFPEGTRSNYAKPDLLPFKKGAFHLAIQAQVPIVPVVVANYSNLVSIPRKIFRPGTVPLTVLNPIETKGKTFEDVDALTVEVRETMLKALKVITEKARQQGVALHEHEADKIGVKGKSTGIDVGIAT
ncbi:hypothetical protein AMS68_000302 [Peltaster fructicola]|uniref:1-acyl-sn-glycerol-3-phosphate acyltransferase n=1 Tax=Peltaster fructicola TaxID=286661 RepID=A0A6H0XJI2_9PEZI|nr:hypothetical protein AMS68_000302 [Peltaster fructicola]